MNDQNDSDEEAGSGFIGHLPVILWQRRWLVIPPFILLSIAGVVAAFLMPTMYRSSATLLVEAQELPANLVNTPITTIVDQRIAKAREEVLSRGDLIQLIEQNDLYGRERLKKPLSEVVEKMRQATTVRAVNGDVGSAATGTTTIAFAIDYDYRDPVKAQAVVQSFVTRFLELDASNSEDQANNTVNFLQDQANKLQQQIGQLEAQMTAIKARNGLALSSGSVMPMADNGSFDAQIASLQNENRQLLTQAKRTDKDPILSAAEAQLAAARATYAETHPDVILAKQRVEELKSQNRGGVSSADNAMMQSQVTANNTTIAALTRARAANSARASSTIAQQSRAPALMEEVMQLDSRANVLRQQYQDVAANVLKAQTSARMAREQKGERLKVVEAPVVPDKPYSPNRPILILGGIGAGLAMGLVLALAVEFMLRPIRGVGQIAELGLVPLSVVPTFRTPKQRAARGRRFGRRRPEAEFSEEVPI